MNALVSKLSRSQKIILNRTKDIENLRSQIQRKHLQVNFCETKGGTELGVELSEGGVKEIGVDWNAGTGVIQFSGVLSLNFEDVMCHAEIDISKLQGIGRLERIKYK